MNWRRSIASSRRSRAIRCTAASWRLIATIDEDGNRAILLQRLDRDAELENPMGGARADVQRAREIIARRGLRGLFEALARKEFLPAVLLPLGLSHLYGDGSPRE